MKRLIITADDFGVAREVNDAVEAAHRGGVLQAASLMVAAPAAADAVERARRMPALRVGLHVVLAEGRPMLPASAVSNLVDGNGMFRFDMAALGAAIFFHRQARREVAAEITAQFEAFRAFGLPLDHCNAHKHFHLHPVVGALIAGIGARFGLRAARVPIEPKHVLRKAAGRRRWAPGFPTAPFAHLLRRRLRAAGLLVPDHVFGLQWSGQMTKQRLLGLIRNLPDGLSEIYLHPATGLFDGAAAGYRYREELDALTADEVAAACRDSSLRLGGFGDFLGLAALHSSLAHVGLSKGSLMP
ncbi:MAG: hopanoid biosynthesis-associated protein HpnK [Steroidobacteraceae bacterium]